MRVLLADNIHINQKNFPSLFAAISKHEVFKTEITLEQVARYGCYEGDPKIQRLSREFQKISPEVVAELVENEISLISLCESEMLTFLITKDNFEPSVLELDLKSRIEYYLGIYPMELKLNLSAAKFWVRFWANEFEKLPVMHASIVFSGSSTYQKALIEFVKQTQCRNFVIEGTLSADRFYFEEKYERIANNSDIKFNNVYRKCLTTFTGKNKRREHAKAINIYRNLKNRNVTQPLSEGNVFFDNDCNTALILCQVLNDYALIEERIYSIDIYKNLINYLSQNGINVIVKTHPWELKKANLKNNHTYDVLRDFIDALPLDQMKKIQIYDSRNIQDLFSASDFVIGINSQALLEAATFGFKSIQLGNAFFGNKGFTHDFDRSEDLSGFDEVIFDKSKGRLTIDEYESFLNFSAAFFEVQTVNVKESGISRITSRLTEYKCIPLINFAAKEAGKLNEEKLLGTQMSRPKTYNKKILKLKRDPYRFFRDSNVPALRLARHLFRK